MSSSSDSKPPPAPDPEEMIRLQTQYNQFGTNTPFGSQSWTTDDEGNRTLNTTMSPQMQGAMDRAFAASEKPFTKQHIPQGMDQLTSAILGKVGKRYDLSGDQLNTNMKQPYQAPPEVQTMTPNRRRMN